MNPFTGDYTLSNAQIFLKSNDNLTVYCASEKYQQTYSCGEGNTRSFDGRFLFSKKKLPSLDI